MQHQQRRTRPDAGWVQHKKTLPTGPNGRGLCRKCEQEVPVGRRTFCSDDCVHGWKIETDPGYVRQCLFRRDHGVCSLCGVDTIELQLRLVAELLGYTRPPTWAWQRFPYWQPSRMQLDFLAWLGIPWHRLSTSLWDADHIVPVVEGGGCCGLENFRTLCIPCHKRETAALRRRLKEQRRERQESQDAVPNFA